MRTLPIRSRRRWTGGLAAAALTMVGLAAGVTAAAPAGAAPAGATTPATVTNGSESVNLSDPYKVVIEAGEPGVPSPDQGIVTGTGYIPGLDIYLQMCNGVNPASGAYTTAANCTYANGETVVDSSGDFSIDTGNGSFQFEIFHGEDSNDEAFNCLAPGDNPDGTTTKVGTQPIDNTLPAWGSSQGANAAGGGTAPCQLRVGVGTSYTSNDIYIPITNLAGSPVSGKPGAPGKPVVTPGPAGTGHADVAFSLPTGGGTVASYQAKATNKTKSGPVVSATGTSSPINIGGLTPGDKYTFTVTAINSAGKTVSPVSAEVLIPKVIAPKAPSAPTVTVGSAGSGTATLTFTPASSGGVAASYTGTATNVTTSQSPITGGSTTSTIDMSGLTPGDSYTFTVTATNSAGSATSPASAATVIPAATKPTISGTPTEATVGKHYDYQFTVTGNPAPTVVATGLPTGLKTSPNGLINGTATKAGSYVGKLTATNVAGQGVRNFTLKVVAA